MTPPAAPATQPPHVAVIGGGLAGMAASAALASAGVRVTLVEARRALGGRASSFEDQQNGGLLDNCQHVLLGCCTNLQDLYTRLGVADKIHFEQAVRFLDPAGRSFQLAGFTALPAPLHLAPSLVRFGLLSLQERLQLGRAMRAMLRITPTELSVLDATPFGEFLSRWQQPRRLVEYLYDPVLVSALNEQTARVSTKYAVSVFQTAMLANRFGYAMGLPACALEALYAQAPCGDVRCNARVAGFRTGKGQVEAAMLQNGEALTADIFVLATNHHAVERWFPAKDFPGDGRFANLHRFESVPILGAHLWFDRPVMPFSHAALVRGPLQWLFRKNAAGTQVHGVISAAREWQDADRQEALEQFRRQIAELFPAARDATLQRGVVVVEKRATFSPLPGLDAFRPAQAPPPEGLKNLVLAGDYTRTNWPATMEGAVRSGYLAAEAAMALLRPAEPKKFLLPDLPAEWPMRLLQRRQRGASAGRA